MCALCTLGGTSHGSPRSGTHYVEGDVKYLSNISTPVRTQKTPWIYKEKRDKELNVIILI